MKKLMLLVLLSFISLSACSGNNGNGTKQDINATVNAGNTLAKNQPTPTDISYSLERYNLIRRAYWVNGEKEKARAVARPAEVPMGYCVLFSDMGQVIGQFNVDGKVTSLNSYLTADYNIETFKGEPAEVPLPDIDGSYGTNDDGIFFFTPQWQYIEWSGNYLYSDVPFKVSNTVLGEY